MNTFRDVCMKRSLNSREHVGKSETFRDQVSRASDCVG